MVEMSSIRTKLFVIISCFIAFFVFISWLLGALFLEDFYMYHKRHDIIDSARKIELVYNSGVEDISTELERTANSLGASAIIFDSDGYVKSSSFDRVVKQKFPEISSRSPRVGTAPSAPSTQRPPPFVVKLKEEKIDEKSVLSLEQDPGLNIEFIVLAHQLGDGSVLNIRLPMAAVSESASYASNVTAFTGILSLCAGCLWAFFFAKKFTVPLLELSRVAQSISRLDFSQKCTVGSNDEIGQLGKSINHLSFHLSQSISELHDKNRQLAADVEKERRLDKLRKNFISSVSHELKTPIALILGYAEGLKENVVHDEEGRNRYCSVIIDEAEKMDTLVRDLLNLSQIESGFFHLERTVFDLSALLDGIVLKYRSVLLEKDITLHMEKAPLLAVNGDMLRIEQIIVNLLNNAIDHAENAKVIRIDATGNSAKVKVTVYNTGKHIPEDSLDNIWLSFYKTDPARVRNLGGYGLGLSIVRAIQELHGNGYGVKNVEGGVLFWFDLDKSTSDQANHVRPG